MSCFVANHLLHGSFLRWYTPSSTISWVPRALQITLSTIFRTPWQRNTCQVSGHKNEMYTSLESIKSSLMIGRGLCKKCYTSGHKIPPTFELFMDTMLVQQYSFCCKPVIEHFLFKSALELKLCSKSACPINANRRKSVRVKHGKLVA